MSAEGGTGNHSPGASMSQLNEEERATLVAYLDGELNEEASQEFEARLSREPALRAEADALKKTWELLDYLPRPEPSGAFTHRTLERLAVRETAKLRNGSAHRWAWLAPAGWAAAMLIAMAGGLVAAHFLWPTPAPTPIAQQAGNAKNAQDDFDAKMARDLGPIENQRVYGAIVDLDFARGLADIQGDEEEGGL
jgi:anti-sigma factor RsiW